MRLGRGQPGESDGNRDGNEVRRLLAVVRAAKQIACGVVGTALARPTASQRHNSWATMPTVLVGVHPDLREVSGHCGSCFFVLLLSSVRVFMAECCPPVTILAAGRDWVGDIMRRGNRLHNSHNRFSGRHVILRGARCSRRR